MKRLIAWAKAKPDPNSWVMRRCGDGSIAIICGVAYLLSILWGPVELNTLNRAVATVHVAIITFSWCMATSLGAMYKRCADSYNAEMTESLNCHTAEVRTWVRELRKLGREGEDWKNSGK